MTIHNIAAYLQCFDPVEPPASPLSAEPDAGPDAPAPEAAPSAPAIDVEDMRRALQSELASRLASEREAHEEALRHARETWAREEAAALGARLAQGLETGLVALRADLARIFTPFLTRSVADRALDELVCAIRQVIAEEKAPLIKLAGPVDLIEKVGAVFEAESIAVELSPDASVDVSVDLSKARIETRLRAWMRRLQQAARDAS
ncbi:hypothetical protein [Methylocystis parvus]|uniref:Flagellar assembly protein FliH/Type III secretion system HrpE domain-containing protein n=1 Tax=Methylocystis parvus TaxID=134 RepID=A0A6B8M7C6_9HYPH|nr:hypothetical protein [Methylocystis parvus]QGM97902.1 hypothetical protein F7D14_10770 [Methylocystis parvus]WBK01785.1 hypothetical protein MMG94_08810 [Methylocystis parvus OBBP]